MAGISSKAAGKHTNRFKFNDGSEFDSGEFVDGSGLELYETTYRTYDPQIGRFHQVDPISDLTESWTPYAFANNNPIFFNDPSGLAADSSIKPSPSTSESNPCLDCPSGQMAEIKNIDEIIITPKTSGNNSLSKALDIVQLGFDVAGLVPFFGEFADGANALIYLARGDKVNAALSTAAMIPIAGIIATGTKWTLKTVQLTAKARKAADVLKLAERILGKGYKEIAPGVFRSSDGLKQFRMTSNSDLIGKGFNDVPHVHIEVYHPGNLNIPVKNYHIPIKN